MEKVEVSSWSRWLHFESHAQSTLYERDTLTSISDGLSYSLHCAAW